VSLTVGYPNAGFQLRAKKLKNSEDLKVKDSSRDNIYAHPALGAAMLERSAHAVARAEKGSLMMVGDLSSATADRCRRPAPPVATVTITNDRAQQTTRRDVGFYLKDAQGRPVVREHFTPFEPNGRSRFERGLYFDDYRNWVLLRSWVTDDRAGLVHIFVSTGLRWRLTRVRQERPAIRAVRFASRAAAQAAARHEHARRPLSRAHRLSDTWASCVHNESRLGG